MKSKNIWKGKFGPLIIAEIGGNHEGNFNYAKKLVRLAISSGVDVVKLQIYQGANLVSPIESKKRFKHFKKFELTPNQHISLAKMCQKAKVFYLASVWDKQSLLWIDKYLKFYKIGSGDLTAYPILSELSKRGKPIILSTGLSTMSEVIKTIKFIRGQNKIYENNQYLSLLQCTSSYPTSDNEVNLNVDSQCNLSEDETNILDFSSAFKYYRICNEPGNNFIWKGDLYSTLLKAEDKIIIIDNLIKRSYSKDGNIKKGSE